MKLFQMELKTSNSHNQKHILRLFEFALKFSSRHIVLNFYCSQIMNCLCQKCKNLGSPTSEIKHVEKYSDFEKLAQVIQHGLQGLIVKISRVSQWRQTILLILCRGGSVTNVQDR